MKRKFVGFLLAAAILVMPMVVMATEVEENIEILSESSEEFSEKVEAAYNAYIQVKEAMDNKDLEALRAAHKSLTELTHEFTDTETEEWNQLIKQRIGAEEALDVIISASDIIYMEKLCDDFLANKNSKTAYEMVSYYKELKAAGMPIDEMVPGLADAYVEAETMTPSENTIDVYNAYTTLSSGLALGGLEDLQSAADDFETVVDTFNELSDEELAMLADLLEAENGAKAKKVVSSAWADANKVIDVVNAYDTFLNEKTTETATEFVKMVDDYDEIFKKDRTLIKSFISDIDTVYAAAIEKAKEMSYNIWLGGVQVTGANIEDILGDGTASYDRKENVLTLNNVKVEHNGNYGLNVEGDIEIKLVGDNSISNQGVCGIRVSETLTIGGNGSLEVFGLDYGIYAKEDLNIGESVQIDAVCGDITDGDNFAIRANINLVISGDAVVNAKAGFAPVYSYGIYAGDNLTVCENAVVTAIAGKGTQRSCGMYAISDFRVEDNAQVKTTGIDNTDSADAFNDSYGIRTTQLYVSGGSLTSTGGNSHAYSAGIFTQLMIVSDGNVIAKGGNTDKGPSSGLKVTKALEVHEGSVQTTAGNAPKDTSIGLETGTLEVYGGKVSAVSGEATDTKGIQTDKLLVHDGSVNATASQAANSGRGIQASQSMSIENGSVEAKAIGAENMIYGMQTAGGLSISGGTTKVSCGKAALSQGIWAFESVNVNGGQLEVTSEGDGIYVPFGSVSIGINNVMLMSVADESGSPEKNIRVAIDAKGDYAIYAGTGLKVGEELVVVDQKDYKIVQFEKDGASYWTLVDGKSNILTNNVVITTEQEKAPEDSESESEFESESESEKETESDLETELETESESKKETESKEENKPTGTPGTGDQTSTVLLMGIMAFSLMLMIGMGIFKKSRKRSK